MVSLLVLSVGLDHPNVIDILGHSSCDSRGSDSSSDSGDDGGDGDGASSASDAESAAGGRVWRLFLPQLPQTLYGVRWFRSGGKRQRRLQARIMCGVASALRYLHKKGVAHRDVQPKNVLVDQRPGGCDVKARAQP